MNVGIIAGISCVGIAAVSTVPKVIATAKWPKAQATVVGLGTTRFEDFGEGDNPRMAPIISYITESGETVVVDNYGLTLGPASVGDVIPIRYDPKNPKKVVGVSLFRRFRAECYVLCFGFWLLVYDKLF